MFFSIGEALIDKKNDKEYIGGGPLNVALAASRLNTPTTFIGGISADENGRKILDFIISNCILFDPSFCGRPEPSIVVSVKSSDKGEEYSFTCKDTAPLFMDEAVLEQSYEQNSDLDVVFFGSLTFSDSSASDVIFSFLEKHPHLISVFDPNVRLNAIDDFNRYKESVMHAFKIADFIKLSDEDLKGLNTDEKEVFDLCKHHLIVTRGEKGATWYSKDLGYEKPIHIDGITVPVIDTIGCGDCFSGALVHWLDNNSKLVRSKLSLSENEIYQALFFAVSVSAMNASREGCNPPALEEMA